MIAPSIGRLRLARILGTASAFGLTEVRSGHQPPPVSISSTDPELRQAIPEAQNFIGHRRKLDGHLIAAVLHSKPDIEPTSPNDRV